jgi:glycosyltransferase involved in cell wall biosynthesis
MAGRMPKGQYGYYSRLARIMAPSEFVSQRLVTKNGKLEPIIRTTGYPIDWSLLSEKMDSTRAPIQGRSEDVVTVGFVGRLHSEKGLLVLADAVRILGSEPGIPPFQVLICGPSDTARGGSGTNFRERVVGRILEALEPSRLRVVEPQFDERVLATIYQSIDVFCYPSLPSAGETFGVGVAEAMAAGAVPVVSGLPCFRDFVKDGINGLVFDNSGGDSAIRLASVLKRAIQDTGLRQRLSARARSDVRRYDFPVFAHRLLADFATLAPG